MNTRSLVVLAIAAATSMRAAAAAQAPPPVHPVDRVEQVSTVPLASAAAAFEMPGGKVLVNDITGHRLLLFDAGLSHAQVVADTTSATANAYGTRTGTLIPFRGDSALFIDPSSLSMLVIGPTGAIGRVMAIPRPQDAQRLIGSIFGTPGIDDHGRLVYYGSAGLDGYFVQCCLGTAKMELSPDAKTKAMPTRIAVPKPDSAFLIRIDLATRAVDTATSIRIANPQQAVNLDPQGFELSIENLVNPVPIVDGWAVMRDGTLAVVRGRDYHVDWLGGDGRWTSSPKMPFEWQHIDEDRKRAMIDSTVAAEDSADAARAKMNAAARPAPGGGRGGSPPNGGRGGGGGGGRGTRQEIPFVNGRIDPASMPDYFPPFTRGAVQADADGRLWIRTTSVVNGQPVYDIVNRQGVLTDRVTLPPFRTIAGFGPGVIYMAVKDTAGVVHLERARVR